VIPYLVKPSRIGALAELVASWPVVVLDTETTGLLPYLGDRMLGFGLSPLYQEGDPACYYISVSHDHPDDKPEWNASTAELAPIAQALHGKDIMGYNLKFDLHNMSLYSPCTFIENLFYDIIVFARIMSSEYRPGLSLDEQAYRCLGYDRHTDVEAHRMVKKDGVWVRKWTAEQIGIKCCVDLHLTGRLYHHYKQKLVKDPDGKRLAALFRREVALTRTLFEMEQRGIAYDEGEVRDLDDKLSELKADLLAKLRSKTGVEEFNPNSNPQVSALMEKLSITPKAKSQKTGAPSWGKEILLELAEKGWEEALWIAQCRSFTHEISNIISVLKKYAEIQSPTMHYTYQNWGTETGRMSAKDPNVMGMTQGWLQIGEIGEGDKVLAWSMDGPDKTISLRKPFKPRPGYVFLDADYRQIEMFVAGFYLKSKRLLKLLEEEDFHAATAMWVWGSSAPDFRKRAKWFNFGLLYGMGIKELAKRLKCSQKQAEIYQREYFAKIGPEYYQLVRNIELLLQRDGYIKNVYGRRYYLPPDQAYLGLSYLFQGSAGDFVKFRQEAIKRLCQELDIRPILTTHDDILFEVPIAVLGSHHLRRLIDILEDGSNPFGMRLPVEVKIGRDNLAEMEEFSVAKVA